MEKWVDVKGFEDYYEVSSLGRVRSKPRLITRSNGSIQHKKSRLIKPVWLNRKNGYYVVALIHNKERHNLWLSQIMVKSFYGDYPYDDDRPCVEFINGDNTDYRIDNMRWEDRVSRNNTIRESYANGIDQYTLSKVYKLNQTHISTICKGVERSLNLPDDIPGEEWKVVPNTDNSYFVSNMGRVYAHTKKNSRSKVRNRIDGVMTPQINKYGYMQLFMSIGGRKKAVRVHRLVALAFCDGYKPHLVVDHIDNDKTNNKHTNLRWVTSTYNIQRSSKALMFRDKIIEMRDNGRTYKYIGDVLGLNPETVSKMYRGVTCREVTNE